MPTDAYKQEQVLSVRASLGRAMAAGHRFRGCTEQEIDDLCSAVRTRRDRLPAGYAEFLAVAGRHPGRIAAGSSLAWPGPIVHTQGAHTMASSLSVRDQLEELGPIVGFLDHQGGAILLLVWNDDGERVVAITESPPYLHLEGTPQTFADWLGAEVRQALDHQPPESAVPPPFE